jgi:tetratricopeptide (TPR) repeat protein
LSWPEQILEESPSLETDSGRFIPEAEARVVREHTVWLLAHDPNMEPISNEEEADRLREEILNEEQRLDDEFDQVLTDIEQAKSNAEVVRLQKEVDKVKAEYEAMCALASWRNDDRESALRSYTTALMLDSEYAVALLNRGNLQLEMGLFENGIADLEKARMLDPSLPCGNADIFKHLSPDLREAVRQSMLKGKSLRPPDNE